MIRFSVICPFYNAGKYLEDAVRSVIRQSFPDWELILVNDGSADDSPEAARRLAAEDPRIRLLSIPHSGTYCARMAGISAASGEFTAFLDSDDLLERTALETLSDRLSDGAADAAVFNWDRFREGPEEAVPGSCLIARPDELTGKRRILERLFVEDMTGFSLCRAVYRSCLFDGLPAGGPVSGRSAEDTFLAFRLYRAAGSVRLTPEVLYHYRINPDSVTGHLTADDYFGKSMTVSAVYGELHRCFPDLPAAGMSADTLEILYSYCIQAPMIQDGKEPYEIYRRRLEELGNSALFRSGCLLPRTGRPKLELTRTLFRYKRYKALYVLLSSVSKLRSAAGNKGRGSERKRMNTEQRETGGGCG